MYLHINECIISVYIFTLLNIEIATPKRKCRKILKFYEGSNEGPNDIDKLIICK